MSEVSQKVEELNETSDRESEEQTMDMDMDSEVAVERVVGDLVAVGSVWASHGLKVGKLALQTSARTLQATAGLLGELSDRFEQQVDRRWGA